MRNKFFIPVLMCGLLITSCGGSKLSNFNKKVNSSLKEVSKVVIETKISDNDVIVYSSINNINITHEDNMISGISEITTSTLNSNFDFKINKISKTFSDIDQKTLHGFELKEKNLNDYQINKESNLTILTGKVNFNTTKNYFKVENFNSIDDCNIEYQLTDSKLTRYTCSYVADLQFLVKITSTYSY